jgi:RHS repeat-associated protein
MADATYDAFGRRIKKDLASGTDVEYLYDLANRPVTEILSSNGNFNRSEIFAGGMHVATYSQGFTTFVYADWMGTERARTDLGATVQQYCAWTDLGKLENCSDYYSYPDVVALSPHGYAGYEYDKESGLHHMWFRNYNPRIGRFMTTDPYGGSMDISDPQSINRYAYVLGNPTNFYDPLGLQCADGKTIGACPGVFGPTVVTLTSQVWGQAPGGVVLTPTDAIAASAALGRGIFAPLIDGEWLGNFGSSLVTGWSLDGARQKGESWSQCVSRAQNELLGSKGSAILDAAVPVSAVAAAATQPFSVRAGVAMTIDDYLLTDAKNVTGKITTNLAGGLARAAISEGTVAARTALAVESGTMAASRLIAPATAALVGLKGGFMLACR